MTQETTEGAEAVATRTLTPWLWGLPLAAVLVELGENHCTTCFADGMQMVTGCTFGKSYARLAGERHVCIPCHAQLTGLREPGACA